MRTPTRPGKKRTGPALKAGPVHLKYYLKCYRFTVSSPSRTFDSPA